MKSEIVLEAITVARNDVADAESELATLLKEIESAPRAEKTTISEALRTAIRKLRDGREHLVELETLIRGKDD
jgi:hypothetical protein